MIKLTTAWLDVVVPFCRIAAAIAILVALAGGVYAVRHHGVMAERARWVTKTAAADAAWQKKIDGLNAENRAAEQTYRANIAVVAEKFTQEQENAKTENARLRAAVRAGTLRLRDPHITEQSCPPATGQATPAASRSDDRAPGELSREAAEFLFGLASEADALAEQLAYAQQVIRESQRLCGEQNKSPAKGLRFKAFLPKRRGLIMVLASTQNADAAP